MELRKVGERTYYIAHSTNIGIWRLDEERVCLIDTGNAGDGEKIDEILCKQGWRPAYIVNTHTHIDHLGGNDYLMKKYDIPAYCTSYDMAFAHYSELEAAYMNGGYPAQKLRSIFRHPGMIGFKSIEEWEQEELEWIYLPGHSFGMIGVKTQDDVWFLGDSYLSRDYLTRHMFGFLYNAGAYIETLEALKSFRGAHFIPSHGIEETDIAETLQVNIKNFKEICDILKEICGQWRGSDEIIQQMYERLRVKARTAQQALLSSTIRSYLTYLQDGGELECGFIDNTMKWKTIV